MNRPAPGTQSLRGLPSGFPSAQQIAQTRSTSSRLPNGKMPNSGSTWAFGGNVPMGTAGLQNPRPNNGPMTSFAQTIGGSQPATPLDLSEFPSLSTNPQQQNANAAPSLWAMSGTRSLASAGSQRSQQQSILTPQQQNQAQQQTQQQQDDLFSSSSQLPNSQAAFRFGGQNAVGQISQAQNNTADEFPPLNRNVNGDIGQDRTPGLLKNSGFGGQTTTSHFGSSLASSQGSHSNGLLNALSSSARATSNSVQATSPSSLGGPATARSASEIARHGLGAIEIDNVGNNFGRSPLPNNQGGSALRDRDRDLGSQQLLAGPDSILGQSSSSQQARPGDFRFGSLPEPVEEVQAEVEDPLPGMSDKDRWGLKGFFTTLKGSYPDQAALIAGIDISALGLDLTLTERISEMIWSPWDDLPARPDIPKFTLPECYQVHNVQPIENKMSSFSDETLMMMFYSNPQDIQQLIAAQELTNRNWRYHKKLQMWLTKDDLVVPQPYGVGSERGYYIFFDCKLWGRERRELVLNYDDLEPVPLGSRPLI